MALIQCVVTSGVIFVTLPQDIALTNARKGILQ
ncbi:Mrp family chromosome partitioning ATPase [Polaromonas sp. CG_9.7]|nr:Mrp family chromosome partitioning ATPase [Polaromonas sp. CG_9.7]MBG6112337.1 Mrp family chromosome partitioning ATPase [Polaromonas sp. CG_9.2]MDH6183983.1 Mrp family chromosome partitioning ATPase [Polaromonas sp. CG_23.6]